jgi:hypothetical protein
MVPGQFLAVQTGQETETPIAAVLAEKRSLAHFGHFDRQFEELHAEFFPAMAPAQALQDGVGPIK